MGGAIQRNRTFFFLSYEGLRQTQDLQSAVQEVPSLSFKAQALQQSPVIAPLINAFPNPTGSRKSPRRLRFRLDISGCLAARCGHDILPASGRMGFRTCIPT